MKRDLKYLYGDPLTKRIIIVAIIFLTVSCVCMSIRPIDINQESKYTILANVSNNSLNHLHYDYNFSELNITENSSTNKKLSTDLWSWGKIPMGYELNKNGTLTKQANEEWKPSI